MLSVIIMGLGFMCFGCGLWWLSIDNVLGVMFSFFIGGWNLAYALRLIIEDCKDKKYCKHDIVEGKWK